MTEDATPGTWILAALTIAATVTLLFLIGG
jgi:hypothetical protein